MTDPDVDAFIEHKNQSVICVFMFSFVRVFLNGSSNRFEQCLFKSEELVVHGS